MSDIITVAVGEIDGLANTLDDVATDYKNVDLDASSLSTDVTGHVELAVNLPNFANFVNEVMAALAAQSAAFAGELRVSSQLLCDNEELTYETIRSIQMPTFDAHAELSE